MIHIVLKRGLYKKWGYENIMDFWKNLELYRAHFNIVDISQREMLQKFDIVLNSLIKDAKLLENYDKMDYPGGKDIMNICSAEISKCEKLVTCDSDYKVFKKVSNKFENLKKIIFLNRKTGKFKEEIL